MRLKKKNIRKLKKHLLLPLKFIPKLIKKRKQLRQS